MTESRVKRKEKTRRAILDAALALSADSTLVALSLRQVAKEVGIVPTAFYRHFARALCQQQHRHTVQVGEAGHLAGRGLRIGRDHRWIGKGLHGRVAQPNTRARWAAVPAVTPSATAQLTVCGARAMSPAA